MQDTGMERDRRLITMCSKYLPDILSLNGKWQCGENRRYDRMAEVPGLAANPKEMSSGDLWYRKAVALPEGDWTNASLTLKGARFCPEIYVNGESIGRKPGGMAEASLLLAHRDVRPGGAVELEIALKSLQDVDPQDASRIPDADTWRSNISSCLWDDVTLRFHKDIYITRLIPFADIETGMLTVSWELKSVKGYVGNYFLRVQLIGMDGEIAADAGADGCGGSGKIHMRLGKKCRLWSPEEPVCYKLVAMVENSGGVEDIRTMSFGLKEFKVKGSGFTLNGSPIRLRAGSVVWHRWCRDPGSHRLAFNREWFEKNILLRLKGHGANTIRFHLGNPPEAFLDLCDHHGLMVQLEWCFFHGMKASRQSLLEQWRLWLDQALRHPSVCLIHPWNETEDEELIIAEEALRELAAEYPPLVISHRDVLHIHKYWWSIFENVGLYYDSAEGFGKPVMADEFGGNYLDGEANPGFYPTVNESFLRFLGRNHTKELRLQLHTEANARIAEYWRRIGAAGFSPFCILGAPEDGNHHFMGRLGEATPKPVWDALTAAYSPISLSLDVWDRNYLPGERIKLPVVLFNDTGCEACLKLSVAIAGDGASGPVLSEKLIEEKVQPYGKKELEVSLELPEEEGNWRFAGSLKNPPDTIAHPVISEWRFRTMNPKVASQLHGIKIGIPCQDEELEAFFKSAGLAVCPVETPKADIIVTGRKTWRSLTPDIKAMLEKAIEAGRSVVMLDAGPMGLGKEYLSMDDLGYEAEDIDMETSGITEVQLMNSVMVSFCGLPEPESCIHPTDQGEALWNGLDGQAAWLWNGLRGGIIAPVFGMEVTGINDKAFKALWTSRGLNISLLEQESCFAYELAGYFRFSCGYDEEEMERLRTQVRFLVEDAPALKYAIDPEAPIAVYDIAGLYKKSLDGRVEELTPLVNCGKNLLRSPVVELGFGKGKGKLILSQLITAGRLVKGHRQKGRYGIRYDPAAAQLVLNLMTRGMKGCRHTEYMGMNAPVNLRRIGL